MEALNKWLRHDILLRWLKLSAMSLSALLREELTNERDLPVSGGSKGGNLLRSGNEVPRWGLRTHLNG